MKVQGYVIGSIVSLHGYSVFNPAIDLSKSLNYSLFTFVLNQMTVQTFDDGGYVVTGDSIPTYRLLTLRTALKMETKGLRVSSHRPSAYSIIKKEFGLKGSKAKVLAAFESMLVNDYGIPLTGFTPSEPTV